MHYSTFSKNYERRFAGNEIFKKIFEKILTEAIKNGFVDASAIFIDSTHVKASANKKKAVLKTVQQEARHYQHQLDDEIRKDSEAHRKKPLKDDDDEGDPPTHEIKESTTDPECGLFHKGEHKIEFAYTAHTVCDKHNFVLGCELSPGNVHDSVMVDGIYAKAIEQFPEAEYVAIDSGYKTPWIMKQVFDSGRKPATPYKSPMTKNGFFKKHEYVYDKYYDCVICPNSQVLKYSTTNREGYREYKSDPKICENCPMRAQCTESKNRTKTVTLHVWKEYMDLAEDVRHTPEGKAVYGLRSQTIERVFADAKEKHSMRYTQFRGKAKVTMQVLLTFVCMNLKKLAIWKRRKRLLFVFLRPIPVFAAY